MTSSKMIVAAAGGAILMLLVIILIQPGAVVAPEGDSTTRMAESSLMVADDTSAAQADTERWAITEEPTGTSAQPEKTPAQAIEDIARGRAPDTSVETATIAAAPTAQAQSVPLMLKDVGEPFLEDFGLSADDFSRIKSAGVDIIQSNFDICADVDDVHGFLDSAHAVGLKVILPAGAGEAEWGFACNAESYPPTQKYVWQKDAVLEWVNEFKNHPALYAWDTSNEAGGNFPNARPEDNDWRNEYALTAAQLQEVYAAIKTEDPNHPIMIRMNGWFFYDYSQNFFRGGNPFGPGVADIVMVNAYANVEEHFDDMVQTVAERTEKAVHEVAPNTKIIVALGAWTEAPMWFEPTVEEFISDFNAAVSIDPSAVAVFKYGAKEGEWWMPASSEQLWNTLSHLQ